MTLPVSLPAVLDIASYLFINALTTTSAVVFLYSTDTVPASVAVLNMDDAGQTGAAAAMAVMIMLSAALAKLLHMGLEFGLFGRLQDWRKR
ncbi:ABC transporter, permease protein [Vibrio cholerae]|nr:ABC transporter, permease protein [Vibrio cholerae]